MNAIDDDITAMLAAAVEEGKKNWRAIVVGNEAPDFCVGANSSLVLMGAKLAQWEQIDQGVRAFQQVNMALKYSDTPVVVAPAGRTLGGGAEIVMHGQKVRAAVGDVHRAGRGRRGRHPGGRWLQGAAGALAVADAGAWAVPRRRATASRSIAVATVATSAYDAMSYGFIRKTDADHAGTASGCWPTPRPTRSRWPRRRTRASGSKPEPPTFRLPGPGGRLVLEQVVEGLKLQGKASEHDVVVASKLAYVLTGGELPRRWTRSPSRTSSTWSARRSSSLCKYREDAGAHGGAAHDRQAAAQLTLIDFQAPSGSR